MTGLIKKTTHQEHGKKKKKKLTTAMHSEGKRKLGCQMIPHIANTPQTVLLHRRVNS